LRPARGLRILVAEDNAVNRKVATSLLTRAGHQVTAVDSGGKAVAASVTRTFDVLLMDIQMPEMDGIEATRMIRTYEQTQGGHMAIVALTAQAIHGDRQRCLAAGMDGYVVKPLDPDALFSEIDAALVHSGNGARAAARPGAGPGSKPSAALPVHAAAPPVAADFELALKRLGGDAALLEDVINQCLVDAPAMMAAIQAAIDQGSADQLEKAAHTLRGALLTVAANPAAAAALALEKTGESGNLGAAPTEFSALTHQFKHLSAALAARATRVETS
jgi:two-component system sensor histidine kinase/response regulator